MTNQQITKRIVEILHTIANRKSIDSARMQIFQVELDELHALATAREVNSQFGVKLDIKPLAEPDPPAAPQRFREFFIARHGDWPGTPDVPFFEILENMTEAAADYLDNISKARAATTTIDYGQIKAERAAAFSALYRIAEIIDQVDRRCMAADGPVTPTLQEMREGEIKEIWERAKPYYEEDA